MRLVELLVVIANSLTLAVFVVPQLRAIGWIRYIVLITLALAVGQVLVEGPRWQMVPAYVLTISLFSIWLLGIVVPGDLPLHRLASLLSVGVGILVLAISILLPNLLPVFHFPKPSGPYAIGTVTYHWVDPSQPELFTPNHHTYRELIAQVWYPAKNEPQASRAPYIQDADIVTPAIGRQLHLPEFALSHLSYVTTDAVASAPVADERPSYPVLIYLTGIDGFRSVSTFQVEALVSHGYIVVGLDQPGGAPPGRLLDGQLLFGWSRDQIQPLIMQSVEPQPKAPMVYGRVLPNGPVPYLAQDASFTLDQLVKLNGNDPNHLLAGRLDLAHAGVFGVSLGGMEAAWACWKDPRLKACLIMDVAIPADVVKAGLKQPVIFITRDAGTMRLEHTRNGTWSAQDIALALGTMRSVYDHLPSDGYYIEIPGMFHVNFTDLPYWSPIMSQLGLTGPINAQRGFDIVNAYSIAFFDKELKNQPSPLLDGPSQ